MREREVTRAEAKRVRLDPLRRAEVDHIDARVTISRVRHLNREPPVIGRHGHGRH